MGLQHFQRTRVESFPTTHSLAEQLPDVLLIAPHERRKGTGRGWRRVGRQQAEKFASPALRSEIDHADRAAGPADSEELVGHLLLIGCEHRAKARRHDIELFVFEGKRLGVALDPFDVDSGGAGCVAACIEVLRVRSDATTEAPVKAARMAMLPVPAATSRTRWPREIPARVDEHRTELPDSRRRKRVVVRSAHIARWAALSAEFAFAADLRPTSLGSHIYPPNGLSREHRPLTRRSVSGAVAKHHDRLSELLDRASKQTPASAPSGDTQTPEVTAANGREVDVLSDVLRTVRLTGALFFPLHASSPWADEIPSATMFAPTVLPGAQHVVSYHIVVQGACWATLRDSPPIRLEAGDIFVVPHGDPYVMSSAPGMRSEAPADAVLSFFREMAAGSAPSVVTEGGGGPGAR